MLSLFLLTFSIGASAGDFTYSEVHVSEDKVEFVDPQINNINIFAGEHPSLFQANEATVCGYLGLSPLHDNQYTVAETVDLKENTILAKLKQKKKGISVKQKNFTPEYVVPLEALYNATVGLATAGMSTKLGYRKNRYFSSVRCYSNE